MSILLDFPHDHQRDRELMWKFEGSARASASDRRSSEVTTSDRRESGKVSTVLLLWGLVSTVLIAAIGVCFFVQWKISH